MSVAVSLSEIDSARFGIQVARANAVTVDNLPAIVKFCLANRVAMLVARCEVGQLKAAQAMEREGFLLMDTLLTFYCEIDDIPALPAGVMIRPVQTDETGEIGRLAGVIFHNYDGHYHADERLDRATCDAVYVSWAERSCLSREVAAEMLVAEVEGKISGFLALRLDGRGEGDVALYGVAPDAQGKGVGRALVTGAMRWLHERGIKRIHLGTQVTNVASQRVCVGLGFRPEAAHYTFHKWFDKS